MAADSPNPEALIDIAVLDDDLDFRNYMEDVLKDEGAYTVRTFAHPHDLFAAAEQQPAAVARERERRQSRQR